MAGNCISISSRALHRLLAGEITQQQFFAAHGWDTLQPSSRPNPFSHLLRQGQMVIDAKLKYGGDEDDEWVTLQFGEPDAATTSFVVTPTNSTAKLKKAWQRGLAWTKSLLFAAGSGADGK
jgi:hypothetical protein